MRWAILSLSQIARTQREVDGKDLSIPYAPLRLLSMATIQGRQWCAPIQQVQLEARTEGAATTPVPMLVDQLPEVLRIAIMPDDRILIDRTATLTMDKTAAITPIGHDILEMVRSRL